MTPRELLLAGISSTLSLWECGRDVPDVAQEAARDLLALWAGQSFVASEKTVTG